MKIVRKVQEIWSGHESVTDGMTDERTEAFTFGYFLGTYSVRKRSQKKCKYPTNPSNFLRNNPHFEFISSLYMQMRFIPYMIFKNYKGALAWYGKLVWESAHAWILIILCYLLVWGKPLIFMVRLSFYAIQLLIYDVMNNITIIP